MQRREDLIQQPGFIRKKACLSTSTRVRYYRSKRAIAVGTTRGRVRSRCSMQVSARKLGATFWKMNEMPLSEVMEEKLLQGGENLSAVLSASASVSHLSDHTPCGSVSHTEINYQTPTPREPLIGVRTRLKDVNNALVTSKELLKVIDRILAHNDQLASSMSLISALHSELERACLQLNQLLKEHRSDHRETAYLVKCFGEERASYGNKQQAVESGELKAERRLRCQYESLNSKLGRELTETNIAFTSTMKELESEKKARRRTEQVCHELASEIGHKEFEREHNKILQLSGKIGGKKVDTKLSECKDQFDEKNGVVEKLRNQFEALFKSKKSEKTSCDKITKYSSRTHFRSNRNEEKECGGEVGDSSAESDLHSIELNMDSKRGSFKWARASTAAMDVLSSDDGKRARKYISEIVPRKSSYIKGSVSDGFQRSGYTRSDNPELRKFATT